MEDRGIRLLWRPVRARVVLKHSGQLALALALFTLIPVVASVLLGDYDLTPWYGLIVVLLGVGGYRLARLDAPTDVRANEALVIPALSFLIAPFLFSIPAIAGGVAPLDALFESTSGITTTGLSTLGSVAGRPPTLIFARAWEQWVGGLGMVVFALALFIGPGVAALRLGSESLATEGLARSTRSRARLFLGVYLALTAGGLVLLLLCGMSFDDAVVHTFGAVSTGGFSTYDQSLAGFGSWIPRTAVMALCVLGAISFSVYLPKGHGRGLRAILRNPGLLSLLGLATLVGLLLVAIESLHHPADVTRSAGDLFLAAFSAQTTAGFASSPLDEVTPASKLVLVGSMVIGGNVGSTAGGIKLLRLLVLARIVQTAIRRRSLPEHAVLHPSVGGQRIEDADAVAALSLALLFVGLLGVSWLAFLVYGHDPIDSLFEVASAVGTVGLSTGLTGPDLEAPLKWVLCADMWLGRVEVLPLLVALHPSTWRTQREESAR